MINHDETIAYFEKALPFDPSHPMYTFRTLSIKNFISDVEKDLMRHEVSELTNPVTLQSAFGELMPMNREVFDNFVESMDHMERIGLKFAPTESIEKSKRYAFKYLDVVPVQKVITVPYLIGLYESQQHFHPNEIVREIVFRNYGSFIEILIRTKEK